MEGSFKDIQSWFLHEVYYWRLTGSVLCTSVAQLFLFIFVTFLLNVDVFEPFQWFSGGIPFFLSLIGYGIVLTSITVLLSFTFAANYKLSSVVFSTVFDLIVHFVHPRRLAAVFGFAFIGGSLSFLYLRAAGNPYSVVTKICDEEYGDERSELCLNPNYVLLLLSGFYVGFVNGIGICVNNYNYVSFPIIQQSKFVQIKGTLLLKLKDSMKDCFLNLKWFILIYAVFGFKFQVWFAHCLHVNFALTSWLAVLFNIVDFHLLWTLFVVATAVHFQFTVSAYLFQVFQTERFAFMIESPFESDACRTLLNALRCVEFPIVRHLSFLELSLVAQQSLTKRRDIFSLSHLGGHPHNWNEIAKECLKLVRSITKRICTFCEPPSTKPSSETLGAFVLEQRYSSPTKLNSTDLAYELWQSQRSYVLSPIVTSKSPEKISKKNVTELPFPFNLLPLAMVCLKQTILQKLYQSWSLIKSYPLVELFIKEYQETSIRKIFVESQLEIWAIEAISFLVAASFKEDKYGVVQKDLPDILTSLLDLHQALKKLQKMETGVSRQTSKFNHPSDSLKASLRSSVKLALYRITTTFGNHLTSVCLSSDNRNQLNQFLTFQE